MVVSPSNFTVRYLKFRAFYSNLRYLCLKNVFNSTHGLMDKLHLSGKLSNISLKCLQSSTQQGLSHYKLNKVLVRHLEVNNPKFLRCHYHLNFYWCKSELCWSFPFPILGSLEGRQQHRKNVLAEGILNMMKFRDRKLDLFRFYKVKMYFIFPFNGLVKNILFYHIFNVL